MQDRIDAVFGKDPFQGFAVTDIPEIKARRIRHRPAETSGEAIENNNLFASIQQCPNHMATNVARSTCHQNSHVRCSCQFCSGSMETCSALGDLTAELNGKVLFWQWKTKRL